MTAPGAAPAAGDQLEELPGPALPEHPVLARLQTEGTLGSRVRRGLAWTALTRIVLQVVTLGGQAVLARLLLPADYGLVALALVINGFATLVTELGLAAAVVQSRRLTERLMVTAFWVNALSGLLVTAVVFAIAPLVGWFYGDPRVVHLVQLSSLGFVLNVASVHQALLQRSLRFRTIGALDVTTNVVGLSATIALAFGGFGASSLVLGPLVQVVVKDVLVWSTVRWWPRGFVGRRELAELWRFGGGLTGSNILYFISRNTDTVALGKVVSAGDLGLYSRSYTLMMMPLTQVTTVFSRVLLPAFSQMQHDLPRLGRAWTTTVRSALFVGLPIGLGVACTAPALIETLYGSRWLGMVTILTLLAASVPPQLVGRNTGPVLQALGRTGLQFRLAILSTAITLVAIAVGLPWGITGVALALLVQSWLTVVMPLRSVMRLLDLSVGDLWRALRGLLLASVGLVGAALAARWAGDGLAAPALLAVQTVAGGVLYLGVLWLVERELVRTTLARFSERRRSRSR